MEAKGKVVLGLASQRGHRAYVKSLSDKAKKEIVVDKEEETRLLQGLKDSDTVSNSKQTKTRWFNPDTREALKIRWKNKGKEQEGKKVNQSIFAHIFVHITILLHLNSDTIF